MTCLGSLMVGARDWVGPAVALGCVAILAVLVAYARSPATAMVRVLAATLKIAGLLLLILCLLEPLWSDRRPKAGANLVVVLADNSQSLQVRDPRAQSSRAEQIRLWLAPDQEWQTRLEQGFDVRSYAFDTRLRPMQNLAALAFDGERSALAASLQTLAQRYRDRSLSGVLLFTDGLATDEQELERLIADRALPPVFPVLPDSGPAVRDLRVEDVAVTETNFEEAPVVILARVQGVGFDKSPLVGQLRSEAGELVESQEVTCAGGGESTTFRFQFRPAESGVAFYEFLVCAGRRRRLPAPAGQHRSDARQQSAVGESESRPGPLSSAVRDGSPELGIQVSPPGRPERPGSGTRGAAPDRQTRGTV